MWLRSRYSRSRIPNMSILYDVIGVCRRWCGTNYVGTGRARRRNAENILPSSTKEGSKAAGETNYVGAGRARRRVAESTSSSSASQGGRDTGGTRYVGAGRAQRRGRASPSSAIEGSRDTSGNVSLSGKETGQTINRAVPPYVVEQNQSGTEEDASRELGRADRDIAGPCREEQDQLSAGVSDLPEDGNDGVEGAVGEQEGPSGDDTEKLMHVLTTMSDGSSKKTTEPSREGRGTERSTTAIRTLREIDDVQISPKAELWNLFSREGVQRGMKAPSFVVDEGPMRTYRARVDVGVCSASSLFFTSRGMAEDEASRKLFRKLRKLQPEET